MVLKLDLDNSHPKPERLSRLKNRYSCKYS